MSVPQSQCVIFAGPNGSGKSTLIRKVFADHAFEVPDLYINADDIARELTEGTQLDKEKTAFRRARQLREDYRQAGLSYSFETVFSHPSTLLDLIKLRAAGYETTFVFVATISAEINVDRVSKRVKTGGHYVPKDKIRSRYERAFQFLPLAAELADRTTVYDNTYNLSLICDVQGGAVQEITDNGGVYRSRFIKPFNDRRLERQFLMRQFPDIAEAEIEGGVYAGPVVETRSHFCVQTVDGLPILHDRTLLTSDPPQNEAVRITYRDGYGTIETVSAPSPNEP